jgi:glutamine amidotransferase
VITIVDYGVGNIRAFLNAYRRLNIEASTACNAETLRNAHKVILPGVGDFDEAMRRLKRSGMLDILDELAMDKHVPVLGVCVGMQMLARSSEEGGLPGLGWIAGEVRRFQSLPAGEKLALPHMGWNDVRPVPGNHLFDGLESDARFYFLHSYYFRCDRTEDAAAVTSYGTDFASAVRSENIYGVQFHPEKSHHWGTRLLQNFAAL